jgi:LmbE family N-acetylglucosaminyl deacetylase
MIRNRACGGTLARYSARGHNVTIIYLTRGEAGIPGKTHDEAAAIRTDEALKACRVLGATPVFAGQIDGSSEITNARYEAFGHLLNEPSRMWSLRIGPWIHIATIARRRC